MQGLAECETWLMQLVPSLGYAERFIFETSQISQLFCHQIIWNMKANAYRGDDGEEVRGVSF